MKIDKIQRNNSPKSDKIQGNNQKTMCKYCITDMIRAQEGGDWEQLSNPNFNCIEFEAIKASAGTNRFILTAKEWCL